MYVKNKSGFRTVLSGTPNLTVFCEEQMLSTVM